MTIDLISDMVTRLRNAAIINKKLISLPFNKNNYIIIKILEREGYVFCSTFVNNKDKLFLKLLELIFVKKNFSYNDTRVKNLFFFIRDFVKIHQHPENIKKYAKNEKKTLSFLNTIDNNLIKGDNFFDLKDLADPMSLLISKFKNSYLGQQKDLLQSSSSRQQSSIKKKTRPPIRKQSANAFSLQTVSSSDLFQSSLDSVSLSDADKNVTKSISGTKGDIGVLKRKTGAKTFFSKDLKVSRRELQKKDLRLLIGSDIFDNMDTNFSINHLSSSTLELKKKLNDIHSNLIKAARQLPRLNKKSNDANFNLTKTSAIAYQINKTLDDMNSNLTNLNQLSFESFESVKHENIISTLANFKKSLDEIYSLIPVPISMRKKNKNINLNDLEFNLTKLNKHKDDIKFYLFKISKNIDDLQFYLKRSCQQINKLNLNLRIEQYPNELSVIANTQQKNLENLKYNFRYEFKENLDDIILYFNRLTKILDTITATFNLTEVKKYFAIKSVQISNDNELKSYVTHLPSAKIELKKNLDFVTSKFIESLPILSEQLNRENASQVNQKAFKASLTHVQSNHSIKNNKNPRNSYIQTEPINDKTGKDYNSDNSSLTTIKMENEKQLKEIFDNINSTLTHLPSNSLELANNFQIDDINSRISNLLEAIIKFNNIKSNFSNSSQDFSSKKLCHLSPIRNGSEPRHEKQFLLDENQLTNQLKNVNVTDSNSTFSHEDEKVTVDKSLKMNEKLKKAGLKKRLKPAFTSSEEKRIYYDSIQGKNTFLSPTRSQLSPDSNFFSPITKETSLTNNSLPIEEKKSAFAIKEKPLNLQKYLRKKNNKTFQTLFNPNFSKIILLALNLNTKEKSSIHGIRRISKPSLRCYSSNPIPRSFGGLGVFIVSTNSGIMTDNEAREKRLGGEIMLEIW